MKGVQEKAQYFCKKKSLKMVWEMQPEKEVKNGMIVVENEEVKILWDAMIQYDREVKTRNPYIVVVNTNGRSCATIDIAIPVDIEFAKKRKKKLRDIRT